MKPKRIPLTYEHAIEDYFGSIHKISRMALPFTCQNCGKSTYNKKIGIEIKQMPIMGLSDCFTHVRKDHGEIIKK